MNKNVRSALTLAFAFVITVATAAPIGGYGNEKSVTVTHAVSSAK